MFDRWKRKAPVILSSTGDKNDGRGVEGLVFLPGDSHGGGRELGLGHVSDPPENKPARQQKSENERWIYAGESGTDETNGRQVRKQNPANLDLQVIGGGEGDGDGEGGGGGGDGGGGGGGGGAEGGGGGDAEGDGDAE